MSQTWHDLFVLSVPIAEKIIRPILVYVYLILGLRLAGKRAAQLNPFDLVVLLTLSNTVQNAIIGEDNTVIGGLIGATTLLTINYLAIRFLYRHEKWRRLIEGDCDVLIESGRIIKKHLEKELLTVAQLETAAHRQGFASLDDVERAVLETGGTISVFAKKPEPEVARHMEIVARLDQLAASFSSLRDSTNRGQA